MKRPATSGGAGSPPLDSDMLLLTGQLEDLKEAVNRLRLSALRMLQQVHETGALRNSPQFWRECLEQEEVDLTQHLGRTARTLHRLEGGTHE